MLKRLEEKIFWHVFLGRDRAEVESEVVIDSTGNGQVNALQLLGNLYEDDDDDDASDDAMDSNEKIVNLVDSDEANPAVVDVESVTLLDPTQSVDDVPDDAADPKTAVGTNDAMMEEISLPHEGDSLAEQGAIAANHLHDQQDEPTSQGGTHSNK